MSEEREEKEDLPAEVTEPSESDSSGERAEPESVSADASDESGEADAAEGSKSPDAEESPEAETSDSGPEEEPEAALPGEGTPEGERLREAMRAFDRGDYAQVRAITEELVGADDADPEVVRAAAELRARLDVDPMQLVVLAGCLIFFAWIVYTYVWT